MTGPLPDPGAFGAAFQDFLHAMTVAATRPDNPLATRLREHLGVEPAELPATWSSPRTPPARGGSTSRRLLGEPGPDGHPSPPAEMVRALSAAGIPVGADDVDWAHAARRAASTRRSMSAAV